MKQTTAVEVTDAEGNITDPTVEEGEVSSSEAEAHHDDESSTTTKKDEPSALEESEVIADPVEGTPVAAAASSSKAEGEPSTPKAEGEPSTPKADAPTAAAMTPEPTPASTAAAVKSENSASDRKSLGNRLVRFFTNHLGYFAKALGSGHALMFNLLGIGFLSATEAGKKLAGEHPMARTAMAGVATLQGLNQLRSLLNNHSSQAKRGAKSEDDLAPPAPAPAPVEPITHARNILGLEMNASGSAPVAALASDSPTGSGVRRRSARLNQGQS